MALHGVIDVNGEQIGRWYARRLHRARLETSLYECHVVIGDDKVGFVESHVPADGPAALAGKILTRAATHYGIGKTKEQSQ